MAQEPTLYVIAAPSGGGKTSLIRALLEQDPNIRLSVSFTTRAPRPGEVDGVDYHFIDHATFEQLVGQQALLEHAEVFGYHYGTGRAQVEQYLAAGHDVMLDIDWQGAQQIRQSFPACCSIFILPPSLEELERRLARRGQDSAAVISGRMAKARSEISHWREFDFVVINDHFESALQDLRSIIRRRRPQRAEQQQRIEPLLAELLESG